MILVSVIFTHILNLFAYNNHMCSHSLLTVVYIMLFKATLCSLSYLFWIINLFGSCIILHITLFTVSFPLLNFMLSMTLNICIWVISFCTSLKTSVYNSHIPSEYSGHSKIKCCAVSARPHILHLRSTSSLPRLLQYCFITHYNIHAWSFLPDHSLKYQCSVLQIYTTTLTILNTMTIVHFVKDIFCTYLPFSCWRVSDILKKVLWSYLMLANLPHNSSIAALFSLSIPARTW